MNYKKPNQFCNNEKQPVAILGGGIQSQPSRVNDSGTKLISKGLALIGYV